MNYYNEHDKYAAQWLRNLIEAGLIPEGEVDERDIQDVQPEDVEKFTQCHFFAGIGGWPLALSLAGWPANRPVWTASCPCQPFSAAGKGLGRKDPRHLWPVLRRLVGRCRPAVVFGEQVASKDGRYWLNGVRANLARLGYAVGSADLCAAGIGAPHIRQRLFWVADSSHEQFNGRWNERRGRGESSDCSGMGNSIKPRLEGLGRFEQEPISKGWQREKRYGAEAGGDDFWSAYDLVPCADGKSRRIEPGSQCLVNGIPFVLADGRTQPEASRAEMLKGLGNAIVPQVAAEFIGAYLDATPR